MGHIGGFIYDDSATAEQGEVGSPRMSANREVLIKDGSPISSDVDPTELVNTTNVAIGTYQYPSSSGSSMDGYKGLSLTGTLEDADGTITLTLWASNGSSPSTDTFTQIAFVDDTSGSTVTSVVATNETKQIATRVEDMNYRYYYWQVEFSGSTNTIILNERKRAL